MTRRAPARLADAADSEPLLPAAPMTATAGGRPEPASELVTRWVSAGAPHTSSTASASGRGRSAGRTVAIERPNKIA